MGCYLPQNHFDDMQEMPFHHEFLKRTRNLRLRLSGANQHSHNNCSPKENRKNSLFLTFLSVFNFLVQHLKTGSPISD